MDTKKILEVGHSNFKKIVANNNYFVDKTMLIYDLFTKAAYISLIPRPKRFGKTLNLSMIEHFFDIQKPESAKLFSEFKISEKKDFCKQHQNKYPIINISLKSIKENTWNNCLESFKSTISKLYGKYRFLLKSEKLASDEKQIFEDIILETASETKYKESLENLSFFFTKTL